MLGAILACNSPGRFLLLIAWTILVILKYVIANRSVLSVKNFSNGKTSSEYIVKWGS